MALEVFEPQYQKDLDSEKAENELSVKEKKGVELVDVEGKQQLEELYVFGETQKEMNEFREEEQLDSLDFGLMHPEHYTSEGELVEDEKKLV